MHKPNQIDYSYSEFVGDIQNLCRAIILDQRRPDVVVGIIRGGLVPATFIAQWFDVPMETIHCSLRDTDQINIEPLIRLASTGKQILLVDDIVDSGNSLKRIRSLLAAANATTAIDTAALFLNLDQDEDVDFAARMFSRTTMQEWINFPWENFWLTSR